MGFSVSPNVKHYFWFRFSGLLWSELHYSVNKRAADGQGSSAYNVDFLPRFSFRNGFECEDSNSRLGLMYSVESKSTQRNEINNSFPISTQMKFFLAI